jgi:hypothetical protein
MTNDRNTMRPIRRRLLIGALALLAAGCGGSSDTSVTVTVSRDFGAASVAPTRRGTTKADQTVLDLLEQKYTIRTGGGNPQEIEGVSSGEQDGRKVGWFYYVNGIEATQAAAQRKLNDGDRVWWDQHDAGSAGRVRAVVGAFPEPFLSGSEGKKLPVKLVCLGDVGRSCTEVQTRLANAGITAVARSSLEQSVGEVLRVLVGAWPDMRADIAARALEQGPAKSGVYAKPDPKGGKLLLLDDTGQVQQTLGPGSGLIAATVDEDFPPTWIITGTDEVGVAAAAAALTQDQLADRFALAINQGQGVPVPVSNP